SVCEAMSFGQLNLERNISILFFTPPGRPTATGVSRINNAHKIQCSLALFLDDIVNRFFFFVYKPRPAGRCLTLHLRSSLPLPTILLLLYSLYIPYHIRRFYLTVRPCLHRSRSFCSALLIFASTI